MIVVVRMTRNSLWSCTLWTLATTLTICALGRISIFLIRMLCMWINMTLICAMIWRVMLLRVLCILILSLSSISLLLIYITIVLISHIWIHHRMHRRISWIRNWIGHSWHWRMWRTHIHWEIYVYTCTTNIGIIRILIIWNRLSWRL